VIKCPICKKLINNPDDCILFGTICICLDCDEKNPDMTELMKDKDFELKQLNGFKEFLKGEINHE